MPRVEGRTWYRGFALEPFGRNGQVLIFSSLFEQYKSNVYIMGDLSREEVRYAVYIYCNANREVMAELEKGLENHLVT